jgi:GT2 family glycosyltransferase
VSDDGNASETTEALAGLMSRLKVIQGPQQGPAANRNCGAIHSTGDILIFLDDDCIPDLNLISAYQAAAMKNPKVGVFEGRISAEGQVLSFADVFVANETGGYLWSCNFAVRRELFEEMGGFDVRYPFAAMEDVDLHRRVKCISEVLFLPDARVLHEIERRSGWRIVQHHALSVLLFLCIHGPKATGKTPGYFLRQAARTLVWRGRQFRQKRDLKDPMQLVYQVWESLQLAVIVCFWNFNALLARKFYPPCCSGCESIQAIIAGSDCSVAPLQSN